MRTGAIPKPCTVSGEVGHLRRCSAGSRIRRTHETDNDGTRALHDRVTCSPERVVRRSQTFCSEIQRLLICGIDFSPILCSKVDYDAGELLG